VVLEGTGLQGSEWGAFLWEGRKACMALLALVRKCGKGERQYSAS